MHPNDGRVVSNFIVQALKGEPITLYGDGSQTRSFCYVDDLIEGFMRLMNSPDDGHRADQPGQSRRVHHAPAGRNDHRADRVEIQTVVPCRLPQDDPKQRQPDIALAQRASRLAADGAAAGRPSAHDRLFRQFDCGAGGGVGAATRALTLSGRRTKARMLAAPPSGVAA